MPRKTVVPLAIAIVIAVVLAAIAVGGWARASTLQENLAAASSQAESCASEAQALQEALTGAETERDNALSEVARAEEVSQRVNDSLMLAVSDYQACNRELVTAQRRLDCSYRPSIRYSSNAVVSSDLRAFVGEIGGSPSDAEWTLFWDDASTAIHTVYFRDPDGLVSYRFLVFFEGDQVSDADGVFFINGVCWLD